MKTERAIERDPLPVVAMLDTCLRLAALHHLETAWDGETGDVRRREGSSGGSLYPIEPRAFVR